ncbi:hypothetical protein [Umezawaea sp. Da 62-37]|uniref:hypothetical protein n=1 Tax=Umezawaea sp. Da 62-37 TaxID=3075927 RepID=UPI0028F705FE|nr:hypothetical protein [Umezawaea sp. Da 62-37]WNV82923.1 hypothetical protein RM788_32620 [Umezawaea sp. Da 62-37]
MTSSISSARHTRFWSASTQVADCDQAGVDTSGITEPASVPTQDCDRLRDTVRESTRTQVLRSVRCPADSTHAPS